MNSTSSTLNALLIGVIVVAIMYFARDVLIPLALAGILSFMLAPPVRALQRLRLPRSLAVMIVVLIAFAAISGLGRVLATQVASLADDLPKYQETISKKIDSLAAPVTAAAKRSNVRRSSSSNSTSRSRVRKGIPARRRPSRRRRPFPGSA